MDALCHSSCGTPKNPYCSMAMSAEHRSKFVALHRQWWRLHMSEKFLSGPKNTKQTNKQTTKTCCMFSESSLQKLQQAEVMMLFFLIFNRKNSLKNSILQPVELLVVLKQTLKAFCTQRSLCCTLDTSSSAFHLLIAVGTQSLDVEHMFMIFVTLSLNLTIYSQNKMAQMDHSLFPKKTNR